jgi:hypothetical protein
MPQGTPTARRRNAERVGLSADTPVKGRSDVDGRAPSASDAAWLEIAEAMREKRRVQEEIERLHAAAQESAVRARQQQEEAVGQVLDVLAKASRHERELEDTLLLCTDAMAGLVRIPIDGSLETRVQWQERLSALWDARARALERLSEKRR